MPCAMRTPILLPGPTRGGTTRVPHLTVPQLQLQSIASHITIELLLGWSYTEIAVEQEDCGANEQVPPVTTS